MAYLLSIALCLTAIYLQTKFRARYAHDLQDKRIRLTTNLLQSWDNITLGNKLSYLLWQKKHDATLKSYSKSYIKLSEFSYAYSVTISLLAFLPVLGMLFSSITASNQDSTKVLIIIGSIPRIFLLLSYTEALINTISIYPAHAAQISRILNIMSPTSYNKEELKERIQCSKIHIEYENNSIATEEFIEKIAGYDRGIFTIRGNNGSGKSSLLLLLKDKLGENAYYLPAHHNLIITDHKLSSALSTGQKMVKNIEDLIEDNSNILLLDEWDANLDITNKKKISGLLKKISATKLVIEVRHK